MRMFKSYGSTERDGTWAIVGVIIAIALVVMVTHLLK